MTADLRARYGTVLTLAAPERRYHLLCAVAAVDVLSSVSWGPLLVVLCIATAVVPRWGGPAFGIALALACLGDQMRLQPGVLSVAVLMIAPAFGEGGRAIARWHLCSLWLWAGLHKMLSPGWNWLGASFIAESLGQPGWRELIAVMVLSELVLGITAMWSRLWKVTGVGAVLLHVGVLVSLSPIFGDWNSSVWPWNATVAVAAPLLFLSQREGAEFPTRAIKAVAAVLLAYPALFYVGLVDAYISHNLYSANTASAMICGGGKCTGEVFDTWDELNVPFPPEPRLFRQTFHIVCDHGDVLGITGKRTRLTGKPSIYTETCTGQANSLSRFPS
jgi:hypothetical protein